MDTSTAAAIAVAILKEEKSFDDLTSALKLLPCSSIRYENFRSKIAVATSERHFDALREDLAEQQIVSPIRPTRAQMDDAKRLQKWMRLLSTDNGKIKPEQKHLQEAGSDAKDPNVTPTRKQMNVINKTTIDLNTYSGERGEATVWWEDVKQELENAYPGADKRTKNQWLPLIRKALKNYKTGIDRINEYIQEMKDQNNLVNVEALMDRFCKSLDSNSLPTLLSKHRTMMQKTNESAVDFATRFKKLTRSLRKQGHIIAPASLLNEFKSRLQLYSKVLLDCKEDTMEKIAQWCAKREDLQTNLKKRGSANNIGTPKDESSTIEKLKSLINNIQNKNNRNKVRTFKHRGITRCGDCCRDMSRVAQQHTKRCPYPKCSLKKQLEWEANRKGANKSKAERKKKIFQILNEIEDADLESLAGLSAISTPSRDYSANSEEIPESLEHLSNTPEKIQKKKSRIKISMIKFAVTNNGGEMVKLPALVDTGALPSSYISLKTISKLGLQDSIQVQPQDYRLADGKGHLKTLGTIKLRFFINGTEFNHLFKIATTLSMEVILGSDFLNDQGGIISYPHGKLFLLKTNTATQLLPAKSWSAFSGINSLDFLSYLCDDGTLPPAEDFKDHARGRSLREIADKLDMIAAENDWSIQKGRDYIQNLLRNKYFDITHPRKSPTTKFKPVTIRLKPGYEDRIISHPVRHRPPQEWDQIESQVDRWLSEGKIERSNSPWNTRHVLAKKSTPPYFRLAQDFRDINKLIESEKFPLRRYDYVAEEFSRKLIKSTLDKIESYMQMLVHKNSRKYLAFSTRDGKYHFCVLPFGLSISGDAFTSRNLQIYTFDGFGTLLWLYVWTYVDDDSIGSMTVICHCFILEQIFHRLLFFGITLRIPKCTFLVYETKWCGYIVGYNTIKPDPKKVEAFSKKSEPTNVKELRAFLGLGQWVFRQFCTDWFRYAGKLTSAFRKPNDKRPFRLVWKENKLSDVYNDVINLCKQELMNHSFDPSRDDTALWVDWSKEGIAAVLTQGNKIVSVACKVASPTESRYSPTKGECFATKWAQRRFRVYLLSVQNFLLVTDHRPLLGMYSKKLTPDDEHTALLLSTEEFRSRRTMVYAPGSRNLSDFWTRLFKKEPEKPENIPLDTPLVNALTIDDHDFEPDRKELRQFKKHLDQSNIRYNIEEKHIEVKTGNIYRLYVPVRNRNRLIYSLHSDDHCGEKQLQKRLSQYYWPGKLAHIRTYLQACYCSPVKFAGTPRLESDRSKKGSHITADRYLDIVQFDTYKYEGWWYMTAVDVATRTPWAIRLLKVGVAANRPGAYKDCILRKYMIWESKLGQIPKMLNMDNESSLVSIPHDNVRLTALHYPQHNSLVERMHRDLARICRARNIAPDAAVEILRISRMDSATRGDVDIDEDQQPPPAAYDGRKLDVGQLVRIKKNPRSRAKNDDCWGKVARVTEKLGNKVYHVWDGKRISKRHIDHLKNFAIGDSILKSAVINDMVWQKAAPTIGEKPEFDEIISEYKRLDRKRNKSKIVFLGYPGLKNMEATLKYLKSKNYKAAYLAVPELRCMKWFEELDRLPTAGWYIVDPDDEHHFWKSVDGSDIIKPSIAWILMKYDTK